MKKSWKTTVMGILTIMGALIVAGKALLDNDPSTNVDVAALWVSIMAGIGLITAKDSNVTGGTVAATSEAVARTAS
jgi:hypothetical protein